MQSIVVRASWRRGEGRIVGTGAVRPVGYFLTLSFLIWGRKGLAPEASSFSARPTTSSVPSGTSPEVNSVESPSLRPRVTDTGRTNDSSRTQSVPRDSY